MPSKPLGDLEKLKFEEKEFISLLTLLIGESKYVQNHEAQGLIPEEAKVAAHVKKHLEPYIKDGSLVYEEYEYVKGRPNIKITYKGTDAKATIGIIGCHLDVVPANPEKWEVDPFKLTVKGDKLYGRGTTDCLGHVCLVTRLMAELGKNKPKLKRSVVALFIASEEGGGPGVGVDMVVKNNKIEELRNGPVYWCDSADSQPCLGTAGSIRWHLKVTGRIFHSGLPHKGINALELGMEALKELQERFYKAFPAHAQESKYGFMCPSTMKPTQMECSKNSLNQIPPNCVISGDIRLTPFYDIKEVYDKLESWIKDMNDNIEKLPKRGPMSGYVLEGEEVDVKRGKLELEWGATLDEARHMEGVACNMEGNGFTAICDATESVKGKAKPYSITGSLPLVRTMQREGFDLQICGFGLSKAYHADNEYANLTHMKDAFKIMTRIIANNE
mmetsp:Transcript_21151/g.51760  ORF Transcript_21151/g.51760 Transcript_21151/m.51760 type:complete len:444 (+) Transcript_21151:69-1400(+)|eukprot:CAMPEP_0114507304 /NCGR_PEP_ID=MMETSP0109-20121206/11935_1 /TAXON_ID=29199 /ORGANISM="Chlorarachnion reptans, Strain CCCM449" /LENGTH=443 /DNA_ID=CAMNT_0001686041 /DNA_START=35 /DNA_END=1366 /DNA_ORIENTATION=-